MQPNHITKLILVFCGFFWASQVEARTFKTWPHNEKPLERYPDLFKRYQHIQKQSLGGVAPIPLTQEKINILNEVVAKHPGWVDGYWLLASTHVAYATLLVKPSEESLARRQLKLGKQAARTCLQRNPTHPLCTFFLAAALGQEGSLDGIWTAIGNASSIEKLFLKVYRSPYDFKLGQGASVQSVTRDALGMFYRVVPDSTLLKWTFGIRGDLDKSLRMHQESLQVVGTRVCNSFYLALTEVCLGEDDDKPALYKQGIRRMQALRPFRGMNAIGHQCIADSKRILKDPDSACGYTPMRHQEVTEEQLNSLAH